MSIPDFLGYQVLEGNAASQNLHVPEKTTTVQVCARDGDVYVNINGGCSDVINCAYLPDGGNIKLGPFDNIHQVSIFAAASTYAHVTFSG